MSGLRMVGDLRAKSRRIGELERQNVIMRETLGRMDTYFKEADSQGYLVNLITRTLEKLNEST